MSGKLRITADDIYKRSLIDTKINEYVKEFLQDLDERIEKAACSNLEYIYYEIPSVLTDIYINPSGIKRIICYILIRKIEEAKYGVKYTITKKGSYVLKIEWKIAYSKQKMACIDDYLKKYLAN